MEMRWVLGVAVALGLFKLGLASAMGLIGDEAYFWQCAQRLDWGYADQPPAVALLVAAGTGLLGQTLLGVRVLFVLAGGLVPLAAWHWGRSVGGPGGGGGAAAVALGLPLVAMAGLVAGPDALLAAATLLLAGELAGAVEEPTPRAWARVGLALCLGCFVHYRIAFTLAGVAAFFLGTARGRELLWTPGPWGAAVLGAVGLLPSLLFNLREGGAALAFQFRDRHPWTFDPAGLGYLPEQARITTPGLWLLLLLGLAVAIRRSGRGDVPMQMAACLGGVHLGLVALLVPFADADQVNAHWAIPAWLLLSPTTGAGLEALGRRSPGGARVLAGLATLGSILGVGLACVLAVGIARPEGQARARSAGWDEVARRVEACRAELPEGAPVVVARGWGAAELDFWLGGRAETFLLSFDRRSGLAPRVQAAQYRIWGRDGEGLMARAGRDGLAVVTVEGSEPYGTVADPQVLLLARHCRELRQLGRFDLLGGAKRVGLYRMAGIRAAPGEAVPEAVDRPVRACVDLPLAGALVGGEVEIAGWAFCDSGGVVRVEARVDGAGAGDLRYGLPRPDVRPAIDPGSTDPAHPAVGFAGKVPAGPGEHALRLRFVTGRGLVEELGPIRFLVGDPAAR